MTQKIMSKQKESHVQLLWLITFEAEFDKRHLKLFSSLKSILAHDQSNELISLRKKM